MKKQWIAMLLICSMIAGGVQSIGASEEDIVLQEVFFEEEEEDLELGADPMEIIDSVPEAAVYYVVLPETQGGSVSFTDRGNLPAAEENADEAIHEIRGFHAGDEIEIQAVPDEGYFLESLHATSCEDIAREYEFNQTESGYVFTMPEESVTVNAVFVETETEAVPSAEEQNIEEPGTEEQAAETQGNPAEEQAAETQGIPAEEQASEVQDIPAEEQAAEVQDIPAEEQAAEAQVIPVEEQDQETAGALQNEDAQTPTVTDVSGNIDQQNPDGEIEKQETDIPVIEIPGMYDQEADTKENSQLSSDETEAEEAEEAEETEIENDLQQAGSSKESATFISMGEQCYGYLTSSGDKQQWYSFYLSYPGRITLNATSYARSAHYYLYDADSNKLWNKTPSWNSTTGRTDLSQDIDLKEGRYYFVVERYGTSTSYTGSYYFDITCDYADEDGYESNNSFGSADYVYLDSEYKGQVAINDEKDFYYFYMDYSGRVTLQASSQANLIRYHIYDENANQVWYKSPSWNSTKEQSDITEKIDLVSGKYYFVAERTSAYSQCLPPYTGTYSFKLGYSSAGESFSETQDNEDNTLYGANSISLGTTYKGQVAANDQKDFYQFNMSKAGRINISATSKTKLVRYYIYDSDGNQKWNKTPTWKSTKEQSVLSELVELSAGTYYYAVERTSAYTYPTAPYTGNYSFKLTFNVPVTGVKLNKTSQNITVGKTASLKATVSPSNASNKSVTWKSSNTSVATVSSSGVVTAKKKGTATITVTTADGKKTATCKVTVIVPVTGVKLNKNSQTVNVGKTVSLKATVSPSTASNKNVTWKSSNTAVATVSSKGVVTGKKSGTATITVTTRDGSKKATCKVTVRVPVKGVTFNVDYVIKTYAGDEGYLEAQVIPNNATNKKVVYTSDNPDVVSVDSQGYVRCKKRGSTYINARTADGSYTDWVHLVVYEPDVNYRTHVQTYGWQSWKKNGAMSGTQGQAKRLEGINVKLSNLINDSDWTGGITYRTHVQTYGWQAWKSNGAMSGTSGQAKRLEAIQIYLTGDVRYYYDVYYRVHAQTYGWLDWAKNGEMAGTSGLAKRLEGIQIKLVRKGGPAPGSTARPWVMRAGDRLPYNPYSE